MSTTTSKQAKTALVTGASGRLGKLIAKRLTELGFSVMVHSRDRDRAGDTAEEIGCDWHVGGDVAHWMVVEDIQRAVRTCFGNKLGLIVHNASSFVTDNSGAPSWSTFANAMSTAGWVYSLNLALEKPLCDGHGVSLALTDNATQDAWGQFIAHGAAKSAIEAMQSHFDATFAGDCSGKTPIRCVSLRLPTVLAPNNTSNPDRLQRMYGKFQDTDDAVDAIVKFGTNRHHANSLYAYKGDGHTAMILEERQR